jgi:hypothetical protein
MRFTRYLTEAKGNFMEDIKSFIKEDPYYKYFKTPEDFRGSCDGISTDLFYYLKNKGYKVELKQGMGAKFKMPEDHPYKDIPQHIVHVVVKVENKIVDLTGMQFGFEKIRIMSVSDFKKEFKTIKPFKPFR